MDDTHQSDRFSKTGLGISIAEIMLREPSREDRFESYQGLGISDDYSGVRTIVEAAAIESGLTGFCLLLLSCG